MGKEGVDDAGFQARRADARKRLDALHGGKGGEPEDRAAWFRSVYTTAGDDPAQVPWADLAPKPELVEWLADHPGSGKTALDIACGLGDNAEAIAAAGYAVTAFDLVAGAIDWARRRFPASPVAYTVADLFDTPPDWEGAFDLVHECYTIQALQGDLRHRAIARVGGFVAAGGRLLVITRVARGATGDGPPWPLTDEELADLALGGLREIDRRTFDVRRPDGRVIPHARLVLER